MFLEELLRPTSPRQAIRSHLARARHLDRTLLDLDPRERLETADDLLGYWLVDQEAERYDAYARAIAREHELDADYDAALCERTSLYGIHAAPAGDERRPPADRV